MDYYAIVGMLVIGLFVLINYLSGFKNKILADRKPIEDLNTSIIELNINFKNMLEREKSTDEEIKSLSEKVHDNKHMLVNHETRLKSVENKIYNKK